MTTLFDCGCFAKSSAFGIGLLNSVPTPPPISPAVSQAPAPKPRPRSAVARSLRELRAPNTGRELFKWAKDVDVMLEEDVVAFLVRWGCKHGAGTRIVAWSCPTVADAYEAVLAAVDRLFDRHASDAAHEAAVDCGLVYA